MDIDLTNLPVIDESGEEDTMVDDSANMQLGYSYSKEVDTVAEEIEEQLQAQNLDPVFIPLDENTVTDAQASLYSSNRPRRVTSGKKKKKKLWTMILFFINNSLRNGG